MRTTIYKRLLCPALIVIGILTQTAAAQNRLEGKWRLTGYSFPTKRAFPINKIDINLSVQSTMQISGRAGCNLYSGTIELASAGRMKVGPLTSTDMACDDVRGSFETLFLQTLGNATKYALKGTTLTLTDPSTKSFLRFRRVSRRP